VENLWKIYRDSVEKFTRSPKTIFAAKCTGDRLLPNFPQVFHRHLSATTQVQQAIILFFHSFHKSIAQK
jgi:hypothetical protein